MKLYDNLVQGSDEWHQVRADHFTASECPAMMGTSKYKTRTQLMKDKKGFKEVISAQLQKRFDQGHETEEKARDLLEFETADSFEAAVASIEIDGLKLLASLDGLSEDGKTIFEHKLWNVTLVENVQNNVLEPTYYWQLEQQLLVFGADQVLFMVSDGTSNKREIMYYKSLPERREKLIAGWKQFKIDLEGFELKARQEVAVAREQESFPVIKCRVEGSVVVSNLGEYIPVIKQLADEQMSLILETDQDFADKEAFNKNVKAGRATLKIQADDIEKQFDSLAEFNGFVKQADTILQKLQSHGERQVKESKATKKLSIINNAESAFNEHLRNISETINGVSIGLHVKRNDWEGALKGKRSFEKMEAAVDSALANAKIEANEMAQVVRKNLDSLSELAKDHKFLFSDHAMLLLKGNDDLINIIKVRIAEHEEAEAERKRLEKEKIEREAKEKADREAQAKLDKEREKIRNEERVKAQAEQKIKSDKEAAERAEADRIAGLAQQEEHRIAKEKRDQFQEDIYDGKFKEETPVIGNHAVNNQGSAKAVEHSMAETMAKNAPTLAETKTVREFLTEYNKAKGYSVDDECLIESLTESNRVHTDPDIDMHRWYGIQTVVNEINGVFIMFSDYIITGDNGMGDMGLSHNLDDMAIVHRKERTVIEVYYA
jgi:putative phage-type endonuclease